jgi:hypothetical protein
MFPRLSVYLRLVGRFSLEISETRVYRLFRRCFVAWDFFGKDSCIFCLKKPQSGVQVGSTAHKPQGPLE